MFETIPQFALLSIPISQCCPITALGQSLELVTCELVVMQVLQMIFIWSVKSTHMKVGCGESEIKSHAS